MQSFSSISISNNIFLEIILSLYQQSRMQFYTTNSLIIWAETNFSSSLLTESTDFRPVSSILRFLRRLLQRHAYLHLHRQGEEKL